MMRYVGKVTTVHAEADSERVIIHEHYPDHPELPPPPTMVLTIDNRNPEDRGKYTKGQRVFVEVSEITEGPRIAPANG